MGLLNRIFGNKLNRTAEPNNEKLLQCIHKYKDNTSPSNYKKVYNELVNGNGFLLLPSDNNGMESDHWEPINENRGIKLTSVYNLDGLKAIGVFTSEDVLFEWAQKPMEYTALHSNDVLELCKKEGFDRIVIDSDMPTMFVLERNTENVQTEIIKEETTVQVGTPLNPISGSLLNKLQTNFSKNATIEEVYQYVMIRNSESIFILGFYLNSFSENSKKAAINAVQNAMVGETLELPLELFMLEDEGWYQTARNIEDSLVYKK